MSFAHRLQRERTAKGWSHEQLAAASGVSALQIARIEQQRVEASEQAMALLMAALQQGSEQATEQKVEQEVAPLTEAAQPAAVAAVVPPAAPPPLALHLDATLLEPLQAAALRHGRSLHGEIVARLTASLATQSAAPVAAAAAAPAPAAGDAAGDSAAPVTWSAADLERLTALVAQRLRDARDPLA